MNEMITTMDEDDSKGERSEKGKERAQVGEVERV